MAKQCNFTVRGHKIHAQHIREYPRGVADETEDYYIHIKQHTPVSDRQPKDDDLNIIAAAGIGMIKELYEPFFQELVSQCMQGGLYIRNFWIVDVGCIDKSALANSKNLGNEQNWFDHSRDLLSMVNHFRKQMPPPLVGLGHSMGGCQIAILPFLHPHLFHTLLMIENATYPGPPRETSLSQTRAMAHRREYWPSRSEAESSIRKNPFYSKWHPRAVSRLIENSFDAPSDNTVVSPLQIVIAKSIVG